MVNNCVEHLITKLTPRFETDDIIAQKSGAVTSIALCKITLDGKSYVASMMQDLNGQNLYFLGARCILSSDGMNFRNCMVHDLD